MWRHMIVRAAASQLVLIGCILKMPVGGVLQERQIDHESHRGLMGSDTTARALNRECLDEGGEKIFKMKEKKYNCVLMTAATAVVPTEIAKVICTSSKWGGDSTGTTACAFRAIQVKHLRNVQKTEKEWAWEKLPSLSWSCDGLKLHRKCVVLLEI